MNDNQFAVLRVVKGQRVTTAGCYWFRFGNGDQRYYTLDRRTINSVIKRGYVEIVDSVYLKLTAYGEQEVLNYLKRRGIITPEQLANHWW